MLNKSPQKRRLTLLFLLWSLLFTKCFSLEYLVRLHEVPINSFYYVWCLSIVMATVASIVYFKLEKDLFFNQGLNRKNHLQLGLTILIVSSVLWTLIDTNSDSSTALFIASLLMGLRHLLSLGEGKEPILWLKGLGWSVAAFIIYLIAPPSGYLIFALALILSSVLPYATELLRKTEK